MKKSLFILFLLAVVSCGPTRHAITLQMRHPSKSGLDLGGKIVSVAYSTVGEPVADSFNKAMAGSFAAVLEDDYATGEGSVKVTHHLFHGKFREMLGGSAYQHVLPQP